jgi:hypothetical protein
MKKAKVSAFPLPSFNITFTGAPYSIQSNQDVIIIDISGV